MIMNFFKTAANLKKIQRQGWIDKLSIKDPESVADHSYSMSIMGMIISDIENYNTEKIVKMILLHDLAESEIGDFTPGEISVEKKMELENKAFEKIASSLPDKIKSQYQKLWEEYQNQDSEDAKIVHQLDRLEMALQAKIYYDEGHGDISLFLKSAENEITHPKLKELFRNIMEK